MDLTGVIAAEIEASGPIPFGRYVDLALYHPTLGFYADGGAGRRRDFITSAEVGPLFGAVVARSLDAAWDDLGRPDDFSVVEAGAGSGRLARSVLAAAPRCAPAMRYVTVEVSDAQRAGHPDGVDARAEMPEPGGIGVVLANELCDNLAFDLYERDGGLWWEIRVDDQDGALAEIRVEPSALPDWLAALDPLEPEAAVASLETPLRVPDQYGARRWLERALHQHDRGRVVVLDYAVDAYPVPEDRGWLRTYRGHDVGGDPLDRPGTQDITVDVAVDQLASVRPPDRSMSQADWLAAHGIEGLVEEGRRIWRENAAAPNVAALTARSRIGEAEALCDPAGLGAFRVLEWDVATITA
ncbi:MAG: SAM-dependent methyltransferase [Acidimicrobiales bacterium]